MIRAESRSVAVPDWESTVGEETTATTTESAKLVSIDAQARVAGATAAVGDKDDQSSVM